MGHLTQKLMRGKRGPGPKTEPDGTREDEADGDKDDLGPDEQNALRKIRKEAAEAGSFLTSGGKGGLRPSLVLGIFRRDKWICKACGQLGAKSNGGLGVHHSYQHMQSPKERAKGVRANREGRRNDPSELHAICAKCHDRVHERDRAKSPDQPDADEVDKGKH